MEATIKSMTNARLMLMTAAVLIGGLLTATVGVMGYSAARQVNPTPRNNPGEKSPRPAAAPSVAQVPPPQAGSKPATNQGPLVIQGEVVDSRGQPLSGVDVGGRSGISAARRSPRRSSRRPGPMPRAKFSSMSPASVQSGLAFPCICLGLSTGACRCRDDCPAGGNDPSAAVRLTLDEPTKWTITVLGANDRPVAGLRIVPFALRSPRPAIFLAHRAGCVGRSADGDDRCRGHGDTRVCPSQRGSLGNPDRRTGNRPARVAARCLGGEAGVLKLGRPGRLVGIVRSAIGQPLADVPVQVWVQGSGGVPDDTLNRSITPDEVLRLDPQPVRTGPQGAFQTPPTLLSGSSYRVSIRQAGFVPFVSDWVTLDGERATVSPIRLEPLRRLTGRANDRQGRAVAGAGSSWRGMGR